MATMGAADTWREAGARAGRSTGGPGTPRGARAVPGERPARPPLPPLPPLPSHGRSPNPAQRPAAAQRSAGQGRPAQRPPVPAAGRPVRPREQGDSGRATPGYPRQSASLAPDAGRRQRRLDHDDLGFDDVEHGRRGSSRSSRPVEVPEPGSRLRGSLAVLGVLVVTLAAGFVDAMGSIGLGLITLIGLVGSTALATLLVRRRDVTTLVVAPPLVYLAVVAVLEFVHRAPGDGVRQVVAKVGTELALGQGFTVMAAATGTALVLALIRWAARR